MKILHYGNSLVKLFSQERYGAERENIHTEAINNHAIFFSLRKNGLSKRLAAASFFAYEDKGGEDSAPRCVHSLSANRLIEGSAKEFQDPAKI